MRLEDFYFKMPPLKTDPIIDDTTLRDGAQMAGVAFKPKDASQTAQLLNDIGVQRLELFHYQEPDKDAARQIMRLKLDCRISAW
jgi:isopropylmalate/homocitrate/citramalate synthase